MTTESTITQLLIDLRKDANLTQKELAEQLQVKQTQVSRWEQPGNPPSIRTFLKIITFFKKELMLVDAKQNIGEDLVNAKTK